MWGAERSLLSEKTLAVSLDSSQRRAGSELLCACTVCQGVLLISISMSAANDFRVFSTFRNLSGHAEDVRARGSPHK